MIDVFVLNYNGQEFLEQTLDHIVRLKKPSVNLIFSDNGSTDRSLEIARQYPDLEIRSRNPGTGDIFSHYNLCLQESKAQYISFLHNDDWPDSELIEKQAQFLDQNPDVDLVLAAGVAMGANDETLWPIEAPSEITHPILDPKQIFSFLATHGNSFFICPTAMFRRSIFEYVGGFEPRLKISADIDMTLRILFSNRKVGYLKQPLIRYRIAAAQTSAQWGRAKPSDFFEVIEKFAIQSPLDPDQQKKFEALKQLDLLHVGLGQRASGGPVEPVIQAVDWFANHPEATSHLGGVDRIKVRACLFSRSAMRGKMGPHFARLILKNTELRQSWWLRTALKMKRTFD